MSDKGLLTHVTLPGSHHLHLDPATALMCGSVIGEYLLASK